MKRMILTGILALATGLAALAATQAPPAQPKGPSPKSPKERDAIMALQAAAQSNDSNAIIKTADDLVTKFSDSDFKEWALSLEAKAYQTRNDPEHAIVYAQQALQVDPKAYAMTLLLGEVMAGRIGEHDLDREEKLTSAAKYLNDTIEILKTAAKPNPQLTDDQWAEFKKYTTAEAHNGLGMLAIVRKDWDAAAGEFKTAIADDPQDAYNTRLASVYLSAGKYDDSIALCDKILANPAVHPTIKKFVTDIKTSATTAKAKATK